MKKYRTIGITGFMNPAEIRSAAMSFRMIQSQFLRAENHKEFVFMAGILISSKTVRGMSNKHPHSFPPMTAVSKLVSTACELGALPLIHFHTDMPEEFRTDIQRINAIAGDGLGGFQFNLTWPSIDNLYWLRCTYPNAYVILSVGPDLLREDPIHIYELLKPYIDGELINSVILDPSIGTGTLLDIKVLSPILEIVRYQPIDVVLSGGLCAETVPSLGVLRSSGIEFGTDAQGKIQKPGGGIDLDACDEYLMSVFNMLRT